MRAASRVVGVLLTIAGLGFFALFVLLLATGVDDHKSVLAPSDPNWTAWLGGLFLLLLGIAFILAARHFFLLDVDSPDETQDRSASRFAAYFIAHRREITGIALAGLVISLIRLGAAGFGVDWPGQWVKWPLLLLAIGLAVIEGKVGNSEGEMLNKISKVGQAALCFLVLVYGWNRWRHQGSPPVIQTAIVTLLLAWQTLFFAFGKIKDQPNRVTF